VGWDVGGNVEVEALLILMQRVFEEEDIFSRQAAKPPREESFCSSCFAIRAKALRPGGPIVF